MWNVDEPLVFWAHALYLITFDLHLAQEWSGGCETAFPSKISIILAFETICDARSETVFDYRRCVIFVGESSSCIVAVEDGCDGSVAFGMVGLKYLVEPLSWYICSNERESCL